MTPYMHKTHTKQFFCDLFGIDPGDPFKGWKGDQPNDQGSSLVTAGGHHLKNINTLPPCPRKLGSKVRISGFDPNIPHL